MSSKRSREEFQADVGVSVSFEDRDVIRQAVSFAVCIFTILYFIS